MQLLSHEDTEHFFLLLSTANQFTTQRSFSSFSSSSSSSVSCGATAAQCACHSKRWSVSVRRMSATLHPRPHHLTQFSAAGPEAVFIAAALLRHSPRDVTDGSVAEKEKNETDPVPDSLSWRPPSVHLSIYSSMQAVNLFVNSPPPHTVHTAGIYFWTCADNRIFGGMCLSSPAVHPSASVVPL